MKAFLLTLSIFLLTACGGEKEEAAPVVEALGEQFAIGDTTWSVSLIEGWEKIENLPNPNTIFTFKKETQNFLIHQYAGKGGNIPQYFYDSAKETFFYFEGISIIENVLNFKAQLQAGSPLRTYYQKIVEVPGLSTYLIGSCSHESQDTGDDCLKLLELWIEVAPQKKKKKERSACENYWTNTNLDLESFGSLDEALWRSGYAEVCKTLYPGSIPGGASNKILSSPGGGTGRHERLKISCPYPACGFESRPGHHE